MCIIDTWSFLFSLSIPHWFNSLCSCLMFMQADTPPARSVSLILNMAGTLCQLLMFTYSCDGLIQQSSNIGRAVFAASWATLPMNKTGKIVRRNMIIVIVRTSRCCRLTASGFFPVSLETYTGVILTLLEFSLISHDNKFSIQLGNLCCRSLVPQCPISLY